jgi:hypothetical protein
MSKRLSILCVLPLALSMNVLSVSGDGAAQTAQSPAGRRILTTCPLGTDNCTVIGTVKNDEAGSDWSPIIANVDDVMASRQETADGRCRVMDPTGTPLNVRTVPRMAKLSKPSATGPY